MDPIFSPVVSEAAFLIASCLLGFLYIRVDWRQFPNWVNEYAKRQETDVGKQLPPPRVEVFHSDTTAVYGWFLLSLVVNLILLQFLLPEAYKTFTVLAPILVIEAALGWYIQHRRTLSFARNWLYYLKLTEPENWIIEGDIDCVWHDYNPKYGGRIVPFPPLNREGNVVGTRRSYLLPIDVECLYDLSQSGKRSMRFIVRPARKGEPDVWGVIVGVMPEDPRVKGLGEFARKVRM